MSCLWAVLDAPTRARLAEGGRVERDREPGLYGPALAQDTLKIGQLLQMLVPYVNTRGVNIYGNIYK